MLLEWARSHGCRCGATSSSPGACATRSGTPAEWILVTGTNGKTTTTQLTTHLLVAAGKRAASVGNIGVPPLDAVREPDPYDVLVVELSSFNLHWMPRTGPGAVVPLAAACLNIADDHLDWHGSREAYVDAKATVFANTRIAAVYNRADETTRRMVEEADVTEGCIAVGFGLDTPGPGDFGLVEDLVIDRAFVDDRHRQAVELTTHGELLEAGLGSPHMTENVLAASALARAAGVDAATVRAALATFRVDHHRAEPVALARRRAVGGRLEGDELACGRGIPRRLRLRGLDRGRPAQGHRRRAARRTARRSPARASWSSASTVNPWLRVLRDTRRPSRCSR